MLRVSAEREQRFVVLARELRRHFTRKSPEHADDLVQDTLLRVHQGLDGLRNAERLDAWVWRIARSVWVDHLRRRRPSEELSELPVPASEPEATDTVASWLPFFVASLPEPYRTAVQRVDLDGVSQAELARELGISESGARTRVQRARVLLQGELLACCAVRWEDGEVVDIERRCGC